MNDQYEWRIKPETININGIEVPAPFKPKNSEVFYHPTPVNIEGYSYRTFYDSVADNALIQYGAWRTEDEVKQVVSALKRLFA